MMGNGSTLRNRLLTQMRIFREFRAAVIYVLQNDRDALTHRQATIMLHAHYRVKILSLLSVFQYINSPSAHGIIISIVRKASRNLPLTCVPPSLPNAMASLNELRKWRKRHDGLS